MGWGLPWWSVQAKRKEDVAFQCRRLANIVYGPTTQDPCNKGSGRSCASLSSGSPPPKTARLSHLRSASQLMTACQGVTLAISSLAPPVWLRSRLAPTSRDW